MDARARGLLFGAVVCFVSVVFAGCGSSGGGSDPVGGSGGIPAVPPGPAAGQWTLTLANNTHNLPIPLGEFAGACDEAPSIEVLPMTITGGGSQTTVTVGGESATGAFEGNVLTFTHTVTEGESERSSTVTLTFGGQVGGTGEYKSFAGTAEFTVTGPGTSSCTGTDGWAGQRPSGGGGPGEGLGGSWSLTLTVVEENCVLDLIETTTLPIGIEQSDEDIIIISVPGIGDFEATVIDDSQVSIDSTIAYGDTTTVEAVGLLDISEDGNTVSGPVTVTVSDPVTEALNCNLEVDWEMTRTDGLGLK